MDIDLTYVEIAERNETLEGIYAALARIKESIEALRPSIRVQHKDKVCKLQLDEYGVVIKIEVNMVGRGSLGEPNKAPLCEAAIRKRGFYRRDQARIYAGTGEQ